MSFYEPHLTITYAIRCISVVFTSEDVYLLRKHCILEQFSAAFTFVDRPKGPERPWWRSCEKTRFLNHFHPFRQPSHPYTIVSYRVKGRTRGGHGVRVRFLLPPLLHFTSLPVSQLILPDNLSPHFQPSGSCVTTKVSWESLMVCPATPTSSQPHSTTHVSANEKNAQSGVPVAFRYVPFPSKTRLAGLRSSHRFILCIRAPFIHTSLHRKDRKHSAN